MSKTVKQVLSILLSAVLLFGAALPCCVGGSVSVKASAADDGCLIDPSGFVYEAVKSNRVKDATATIYYKQGETAVLWDASEFGQNNPQTTDALGAFQWNVNEGDWQVKVEKAGYETAYSDWMNVPPKWTNVAIPLVSKAAPEVTSVSKDGDRYLLTFNRYMDLTTVTNANVKLGNSDGNVPYTLTPLDKEASGTDSSVYYAKMFALVPTAKVTSISVKNVKSYAGTAIAGEYTKLFESSMGYTVTYYANGGSGAPEKQTKVDGQTLILSSVEPVRGDDYVFLGWNTKADGSGTNYAPGASYFANRDLDLYAIWQHGKNIVRSIRTSDVTIYYKGSSAIQSTVTADTGCKYTIKYKSSDPSIAAVNDDGIVTGMKRGSATITVTAVDTYGNSVSAESKVTVKYNFLQWIIIIVFFGWYWYAK